MNLKLYINDLMTRTVVCIQKEESLLHVVELMHQKRLSCIIAVDEKQKPIGILTERDLVGILREQMQTDSSLSRLKLEDVMTLNPITLNEHTTIDEALSKTKAHQIRHFPVVYSNGTLAGVVTQTNLLSVHSELMDAHLASLEKLVQERTAELVTANRQLKELSLKDCLMNIGNRRSMKNDLEHIHSTSLRYRRPYALVLFDIDYFKAFNDTYGHQAGDKALQNISDYLKTMIRKADRLYRYGGEEILLLLPETDRQGAVQLANRIVEQLFARGIEHKKSPFQKLTISGGIGCKSPEDGEIRLWQDVVSEADKALYMAKSSGRNRVVSQIS